MGPPPLTRPEQVLRALMAQLELGFGQQDWHPEAPVLLRGEVLPLRIPPGGVVILRDGTPGDPEVLLSPPTWCYRHRAELELVTAGPAGTRDAVFDRLRTAIAMALALDRTLGGLCDWIEAEAPAPIDLAVEGAEGLKAAVIPVVLHYDTADPLL